MYLLKDCKNEYREFMNPDKNAKLYSITKLKHEYSMGLTEIFCFLNNGKFSSKIKNEYMSSEELKICKHTGFEFKTGKGNSKSISNFKKQLTYDSFFMFKNSENIIKMYEKGMSTRDIEKYVFNKFNLKIRIRKLKMVFRDKKESLSLSSKKMVNTLKTSIGEILTENNIPFEEIDIIKTYRNKYLSPFMMRSNNLSWSDINKKCLSEFDEYDKLFIDEYIKTKKYNFKTYLKNKSKKHVLTFSSTTLHHIFGKKILKYFGENEIKKQIKKFYYESPNKKNRIIQLKKSGKKIHKYIGYIDGNLCLSKTEAKLVAILIDNGFMVETNKKYPNFEYLYDIYLKEYDVYIEINSNLDEEYVTRNDKKHIKISQLFNIIAIDKSDMNDIINIISNKVNKKISNNINVPIFVI